MSVMTCLLVSLTPLGSQKACHQPMPYDSSFLLDCLSKSPICINSIVAGMVSSSIPSAHSISSS